MPVSPENLFIVEQASCLLYQIRLHRNDINGGDGGDGSAVSLPGSIVGTRHCRLLYIIPAQPELILQKKAR